MLGFRLGAGPLPLMGNLILHCAYGLTLGVSYGLLTEWDTRVVRSSARKAALGLTAGGFFGFLVAFMMAGGTHGPLGINSAWFQMSGALVGSALGCLIGVVSGQEKLSDGVLAHG